MLNLPDATAVSPDGHKVYITNAASNNVSVIDTATNTVIATIPVGPGPFGVALSPDGRKVYVANVNSGTVVGDKRSYKDGDGRDPRWKQPRG